ncbi:MAG TPA: CAP domain-containing protein [Terriglobia bacterium]|nr:CAP domain-containing protein [Terriglobia bacterium]
MRSFALAFLLLFAVPQGTERPEIRIPDLERRVHLLINAERQKVSLKQMQMDDRLSAIARAHSADMAKRNFFSHINPDGQDPTARGKKAGYTCRKNYGAYLTDGLGENIYQGNLFSRAYVSGNQRWYDWNSAETLASDGVKGWMASDGHRKNILEKNYTLTGVGIAVAADQRVYMTQVFC